MARKEREMLQRKFENAFEEVRVFYAAARVVRKGRRKEKAERGMSRREEEQRMRNQRRKIM